MLAVNVTMSGKLDCQRCTADMKDQYGCEKDVPYAMFTDSVTGESYYRCPMKLIDRDSILALDLYGMAEKGLFFSAGGLMEQPHVYVDALKHVGSRIASCMREEQERGRKNR